MKALKFIILMALGTVINTSTAQQSQQKIEMIIDEIGNATIKVSQTMNASQWQNWVAVFGNNPAALKREIERGMPSFFLDDFKLEKDDMNRSYELSLKAYGACEINKRGKWLVDTEQKDAQMTEVGDRKFMFVSSPPEFGGTMQQTYVIEFPEQAKNIEVDKNAYGKTVFEFEMDKPGGDFNLMRWAGIFLIVVGGALGGRELVKKK